MTLQTLRLLIQHKLADGRLPHDSIPRFAWRPGNGETCDACEDSISMQQIVMEEIAEGEAPIRFHVRCFSLWDAVRIAPGGDGTSPGA
jgi:hypothetical protein